MDYTRSHTIESVFKFSCVEFDKVSVWKLPINVEGVRQHLSPRSGCGQK